MFSVKQNLKVCLKGENLTHHTNHLKFLNAIGAAVVVGSAVPLISSPPAVGGCFASTAASDYEDTLAAGSSPSKAMGAVKRENHDRTKDCYFNFNMDFYRDYKIKPFNNVHHNTP